MNPSIEILVHASGPSRGSDDARYRKEARGLLAFDPATRHEVFPLKEAKNGTYEDGAQGSNEWNEGETSMEEEAILATDLLLEDFKDNAQCRAKRPSSELAPVTTTSPASGIIGKSYLMTSSAAKRPASHILIERTPALPRRHTTPTVATRAAGGPSHRRTMSDSWKTPPSVIPDSQPTPSSIGGPCISSSPYLRHPFAPSSSPSPTKDDDMPSHKRQRVQDSLIAVPATLNDSSLNGQPAGSSPNEASQLTQLEPMRTNGTSEIHPPRPLSSKDRFHSHLTPSLQTISTKLPMDKYYKPAVQARPAEKLERGHWFVPIYSWDDALKAKFWRFLNLFIKEGRAGWGVWCSRECQGDTEHVGSGSECTENCITMEIIRLYGWGEVIGELWVLLYIASERRIKGVGARWFDAKQQIVVQMD